MILLSIPRLVLVIADFVLRAGKVHLIFIKEKLLLPTMKENMEPFL